MRSNSELSRVLARAAQAKGAELSPDEQLGFVELALESEQIDREIMARERELHNDQPYKV